MASEIWLRRGTRTGEDRGGSFPQGRAFPQRRAFPRGRATYTREEVAERRTKDFPAYMEEREKERRKSTRRDITRGVNAEFALVWEAFKFVIAELGAFSCDAVSLTLHLPPSRNKNDLDQMVNYLLEVDRL